MSLEAINEQLLRAVGVGIALFRGTDLRLSFRNDVFATWFEDAAPGMALEEVFSIDPAACRAALDARGRHSVETTVKKRRRSLVLAIILTRAEIGDETVIVAECQNITRIRELESMIDSYSAMVERNTREIQREKERLEKLLLTLMPRAAYEEFKAIGLVAPQRFTDVGVLSLGFTGLTRAIETLPPASFVSELNELYGAFEKIGEQLGCERIKTGGDSFLCIAGMHDPVPDAVRSVAGAAVRFLRYLRRRNEQSEVTWTCRIGLGAGDVLGSVIGSQNYVYDVVGPAVEMARDARNAADAQEILVPGPLAASFEAGALEPAGTAAARDAGYKAHAQA